MHKRPQWFAANLFIYIVLKPSPMPCSILPDFSWRFLEGWTYTVCELGGTRRVLAPQLNSGWLLDKHSYRCLHDCQKLLYWKYMRINFLKAYLSSLVMCWNYMQTSPKEQPEQNSHLPLNAQLSFTLFLSSLMISPVTRKSFALDRLSNSNF